MRTKEKEQRAEGRICESGTFRTLLRQNSVFAQFVESHEGEEAEEELLTVEERRLSTVSNETLASIVAGEQPKEAANEQTKLIKKEKIETGKVLLFLFVQVQVRMSIYGSYLKAASLLRSSLFVFFLLLIQGFSVARSIWLSNWYECFPQIFQGR